MATEEISFKGGSGTATAYVAKPSGETRKAVILIQEYWGLNDHIKSIARRYADEGFLAITPDLYYGKIAADKDTAAEYMQQLTTDDGLTTIRNAMTAAREKYGVSHFGITGYCMGGTFALRAACEVEGISAAAPFYGDIPPENVLSKLRVPTIFIAAAQDAWINAEKVGELADAAERHELPVTIVKYDADHAFFNDTRPEVYDENAANDAWAIVTGLFNDKL